MKPSQLKTLEKKLDYTFKNKILLQTALTHKTFAFEAMEPIEYNERLEFLGDSILNFIIADRLYNTNAYFAEGELTRRRAFIVNNKRLAEKGKKLGIGKYLLLGKGEEQQGGCPFHGPGRSGAREAVYLGPDGCGIAPDHRGDASRLGARPAQEAADEERP